jgi:hypothetical protein
MGELLVWCGSAGVVGAVGGYLLLFPERGALVTAGVVLAASGLGTLVGVLAVAPEQAPPARHAPTRPPAQPAAPVAARPRTIPPTEPTGPREHARLVLPVEAAPQGASWWNGGPTDRTVALTQAPDRPLVPDLATYGRPVRTVQCPRCGAFRIDVQHIDGGYAFRCRVDEQTWTWQTGTAWPVTVVASRRRPDR